MNRIEIYLDNYDRLSVSFFQNINSEYESFMLHGMETYNYIKELSSSKILNVYRQNYSQDITLEYKNYIINLNGFNELLKKRGMGPIVKNLKEYEELKKIIKIQGKKVTRKNKYSNKRIIAGGLAFLVFSIGAYNVAKKNNDYSENNSKEYSVVTLGEMPSQSEVNTIAEEVEEKEELKCIPIEYEDRSEQEKLCMTKEYYGDILEKYASQYGLDSNLVLAIATQERGIHSKDRDLGGATGLMQIQNAVWNGETIYAYNFQTQQKEKIYITKEKIKDLDTNIKIGCMYLQNCMQYMKYNTVAAVQCYNMGYGNMKKILTAYSNECGKSINEILEDEYDVGWLGYRDIINKGDTNYVEHVFSWIGNNIKITNLKDDGALITSSITNKTNFKQIY